jgi:hypothetical protein
MTRAHALLAELATLGVSIRVEGSRLRLHPRSALSESLIARILDSKAELLVLLRAAPARGRVPRLPALQWWVLWVLAERPDLPRTALYRFLPAPRGGVDRALAVLLHRREVRMRRDGGLDLNAC